MHLPDLPGLTPNRRAALLDAGIRSAEDLIFTLPRRYLDRTRTVLASKAADADGPVTVFGQVVRVQVLGGGNHQRLEVTLQDASGRITGVWFKGVSYFKGRFEAGRTVAFFGTAKRFGAQIQMAHPDAEVLDGDGKPATLSGILPIYPGTDRMKKTYISGAVFQRWARQLLNEHPLPEFLPAALLKAYGFPQRQQALHHLHAPDALSQTLPARNRLKFEELLLFQLAVRRLRLTRTERTQAPALVPGEHTKRFFRELPFGLTGGQREALGEIRRDLASGRQMNRLLQGDVGSGKTVVAMGALLMAADSGLQGAIMAPTEILAEQHARTFAKLLEPLGVNIALLTGSLTGGARKSLLERLANGDIHVVVGTHALFQDDVSFLKLGLIVIDEQHRFGVRQRLAFQEKGQGVHTLVMSATPIPRSLAMTLYADLDLSVMRELPAGRKPITTVVRGERSRDDVYRHVKAEAEAGGQAYVVYPLVEESELSDLKDATAGAEELKARFPDLRVGLVHGRMKPEEKDAVMRPFVAGELDVLVSTTVIEVGVDVPNASFMVIEHAERFGLSQLHQLRGRVGRGGRASTCVLLVGVKISREGRERLETMARTQDGFEIAEVDLRLRGPGDVLGTAQSGLPEFRFADLLTDAEWVAAAKRTAAELLEADPGLTHPDHAALRAELDRYWVERERLKDV